MCLLNIEPSKRKTIIGYKVVAKRNGRYYTPFTNNIIRTGKPGKPKISYDLRISVDNQEHVNKWSAVRTLNEAIRFIHDDMWGKHDKTYDSVLVILKIKFSGGILMGKQGISFDAFLANEIISYKEVWGVNHDTL